MRRVYLSFLGTSPYFECNYQMSGFETVKNVRFVQEATIKWFCKSWGQDDAVFIFTTDKAFSDNWQDLEKDGKTIAGLGSRLQEMNLTAPVTNVNIPTGRDTGEIWQIFQTVFNKLKQGDHVFLDITHAFRSLPLLALVILNYAKVTRDVQIESISYGAMEAIGPAYEVKKMEVQERNIPVFDLTAFDQLLDWSSAIDRYVGTGDASLVARLAEKEIRPILAATKGQDKDAQAVKLMAKNMKELSDTIATCRGKMIPEAAEKLKSSFNEAKRQEHIKPLTPLFEKITEQIQNFKGDEISDGISAAQWCLDHGLVQQGITIFLETMVSYVVASALADDSHDEELRLLVNQALAIKKDCKARAEWNAPACENVNKVETIMRWFDEYPAVEKCFKNLVKPRNDINHAGQNDSPMRPAGFKKKLQAELKRFRDATQI